MNSKIIIFVFILFNIFFQQHISSKGKFQFKEEFSSNNSPNQSLRDLRELNEPENDEISYEKVTKIDLSDSSKFLNQRGPASNSNCSKITRCFDCSIYGDTQRGDYCEWFNGRCNYDPNFRSTSQWWTYFNSCLGDGTSVRLMNTYCGSLSYTAPIQFSLNNVSGRYGNTNLFCPFKVIIDPSKTVYVSFTRTSANNANDLASLQVIQNDGKDYFQNLNQNQMNFKGDNIAMLNFQYFIFSSTSNQPFTISFTYDSQDDTNGTISYTALYISISTIIFVIIICSVIFYRCARLIAMRRRRIQENQRRLQDNRNIQLEIIRINSVGNQERLNEVLESILKPFKYSENIDEFKQNCTICLDGFVIGSDIVRLSCKHIFHFQCIKDWITKNINNPKCPNCNVHILQDVDPNNLPGDEIPLQGNVNQLQGIVEQPQGEVQGQGQVEGVQPPIQPPDSGSAEEYSVLYLNNIQQSNPQQIPPVLNNYVDSSNNNND